MPQNTDNIALTYRILVGGVLTVSLYCAPISCANADVAYERANLYSILRQLNALEDTAHRSPHLADETGKRYFFDYQRLTDDIARIRHGLKDYLSPSRAQPRGPVELSGNYTTEGRQP